MNQSIIDLFNVMTKNKLKQLSGTKLAALLKEHIWADLDITSPHSELVEEVIERLESHPSCISVTQYLENLDWAAKSYFAAFKGKLVPCRGCENKFELLKMFRCYHCGSYFCPKCAREHFGKREELLHDAAMLANKNVAVVS